jgi:hypothetical protein
MRREERGSAFWLRVMCRLSLLLGRRLTRGVVYGIALYFVLAVPAARRASRAYLARVLPRRVSALDLYRHVLAFSSTIHDRIFLLSDRHDLFDTRTAGTEPLHALQAAGKGFLLFGAHLGSFEILRTLARHNAGLNVCMAMYPENARRIGSALAAINPRVAPDIVVLGQMEAMLTLHRKLQEGTMIGLLADRATGPGQYVSVPFLGSPANFPEGPFRMAAMLGYPVFFMAGLYRGGNRYDVHFEALAEGRPADAAARDGAARQILEKYVAALERHCRSAPMNWFNFFDFWGPARRD